MRISYVVMNICWFVKLFLFFYMFICWVPVQNVLLIMGHTQKSLEKCWTGDQASLKLSKYFSH